jgi:mRNA interferase RelE/StbE
MSSSLNAVLKSNYGPIPQPYRDRIIAAVRNLAEEPMPSGVKKLTGREAWRIRVGDYRIIYEIQDQALIVLVVSIGHRRDIYQS